MKFLKAEIRDVRENQIVLKNMLENTVGINYASNKSFAEQYSLNIPFKTIEEFQNFNEKVRSDEECCKRFVSYP